MARALRLGICAYGPCRTAGGPSPFDLKQSVEEACKLLRQVKAEGADLALLPEIFALQNCADWAAEAEPLDGYVVTQLREEAKRLNMGIAAGHALVIDSRKRNSLVLIGRGGDVLALYHKAYPTINELEKGIVPGSGAQVVETEFGRIGFAICYDLNFAELRLAYRDLDPDLLLFSSYFRGGLETRWWAYETRSHLVSSCIDPESVIVNPVGRVLAQTDFRTRKATVTLNLDCEVLHYDYTNLRLEEAIQRHGAALEFDWAEPEGVFLLSSTGPRNVREILEEFGWEGAEAYFARARRLREDVLLGKTISQAKSAW